MTMTFSELCRGYIYKVRAILFLYFSLTCLNKDKSVLLSVIIIWTSSLFYEHYVYADNTFKKVTKKIRKRKIHIVQYHTSLPA